MAQLLTHSERNRLIDIMSKFESWVDSPNDVLYHAGLENFTPALKLQDKAPRDTASNLIKKLEKKGSSNYLNDNHPLKKLLNYLCTLPDLADDNIKFCSGLIEKYKKQIDSENVMSTSSNQNLKGLLRAIIVLLSIISILLLLLLMPSFPPTTNSIQNKFQELVTGSPNSSLEENTSRSSTSPDDVIEATSPIETKENAATTHDQSSNSLAIMNSIDGLEITGNMTVTDSIQLGGVLNGPTSYWADYRPYIRFLKQDGVGESDLCPEGGFPIGVTSPLQSLSVKTGNDLASILYGGAGTCINVHEIAPCATIHGNYYEYLAKSCETDFSGKWAPFYWWDGTMHEGISTKLLEQGIGCYKVKYACVK